MSSDTQLTYAAVTPARNEEVNLRRLAASMISQTLQPVRWVIVENGSTDGTLDVARALADAHPSIRVIQTRAASAYERTSAYMRAFHAGVDSLDDLGDLIVKLDADVSFDAEYFSGLARAFAAQSRLGIASGAMVEEHDGRWDTVPLLDDHCVGPTRTYRRSCFAALAPLEDGLHYASVDEARAHIAGFTTATLPNLSFRHHRPEGSGEGSSWKNWRSQGFAAHHMGSRPSYVLARVAFRARADASAIAILVGFGQAVLRREPRYADTQVIHELRQRQRIRRLPTLIALRRRAAQQRAAASAK